MRQLITLILLLFFSSVTAQEELFDSGNEAYKDGDYNTAIDHYSSLVSQNLVSPQLYYNLGNAYFKNQQLGKAILYFEKAYKAEPSDDNIKKNLNLAREEIDSPVIEIPEFFLIRYWKSFAGLFPSMIWVIIQLLSTIGLLYGIYNWRLSRREGAKLRGFAIAMITLGLILLSFFAGRTALSQSSSKDTAIVTQETQLMSAADERSEKKENLSEGVKVKIVDQIDNWYKVLLMNKESGWIEQGQIEII